MDEALVLFPAPTQLSVACNMEKQFFVHTQGEPGNEASEALVPQQID